MKQAGYADTAFAGPATIMRGRVVDASTRADIYALSPSTDFEARPGYGQFYASFRNDPSEPAEPTPYAANAYDATWILVHAIQTAVRYAAPPVYRLDVARQAERFPQRGDSRHQARGTAVRRRHRHLPVRCQRRCDGSQPRTLDHVVPASERDRQRVAPGRIHLSVGGGRIDDAEPIVHMEAGRGARS